MRIVFIGDIVGRSGREALSGWMPEIKARLRPDLIIANGENAAHGFGLTPKLAEDFYALGVDAITLGNHSWDQRELIAHIDGDARMVRPFNFPEGTPGKGARLIEDVRGRKLLVVNMMTRLFMDAMDCPFVAIDRIVAGCRLGRGASAILVDLHGEATSEKMAFAHHVDGRVSAVLGTHTHVPTADHHVLAGGTAYQSDVGMTGDYDSVIGMGKEGAIQRFIRKMPGERLTPALGEATLCGTFIETDDASGLSRRVAPLRLGGRLELVWPEAA